MTRHCLNALFVALAPTEKRLRTTHPLGHARSTDGCGQRMFFRRDEVAAKHEGESLVRFVTDIVELCSKRVLDPIDYELKSEHDEPFFFVISRDATDGDETKRGQCETRSRQLATAKRKMGSEEGPSAFCMRDDTT